MKKRSEERKFCLSVYSHVMFQNFFSSLRFTFLPCPQWWQVVKCQISERCSEGAATRQKGRPSEENQIKCQLYLFFVAKFQILAQGNSIDFLTTTQNIFLYRSCGSIVLYRVSNNRTGSLENKPFFHIAYKEGQFDIIEKI